MAFAAEQPASAEPFASGGPWGLIAWLGVTAAALALLVVMRATAGAWLSDDYLVGVRQILNLLAGNEFSYNLGERVQTMTSPLWGLVMIPAVALGGLFWGPVFVSLALAALAVALLALQARDPARIFGVVLALGFLLASRSFADFSSGGLEGPLAFVLIAAAVPLGVALATPDLDPRRFRRRFSAFAMVTALLFLTRYDYAALAGPAVLWAGLVAIRREGARAILLALPAVLVVLAWLVFATVYFGSPFSNTAFSKLATDYSGPLRDNSAWEYFRVSLAFDQPGFILMGLTAVAAIASRRMAAIVWIAGVAAYLVFIHRMGGDFMAGRFFAAPILVSAGILAVLAPASAQVARWLQVVPEDHRTKAGVLFWMGAAATMVCMNLLLVAAILQDARTPKHPDPFVRFNFSSGTGVFDEQGFYLHRGQGLFAPGRDAFIARLQGAHAAHWTAGATGARQPEKVLWVNCGFAGIAGVLAGPRTYVFDSCGLADPFIARLPLYQAHSGGKLIPSRPGHFTRIEPPGYAASFAILPPVDQRLHDQPGPVRPRANRLEDPALARLYDEVRRIVSGPLFSAERWRAIRDMHLGDTLEQARTADFYQALPQ